MHYAVIAAVSALILGLICQAAYSLGRLTQAKIDDTIKG